MEDLTVTSGADMAAMAPADLFGDMGTDTGSGSGADDAGLNAGAEGVETIETPVGIEDSPAGDANDGESEESEQPVTEEEEPVDPPVEETTAVATKEDDLPEGVKHGKDRSGKQGYFLEENRYKTFHGNHQLVQQVSEMLGEPASVQTLQLHRDAYMGQERLYNDLTSGDPQAQSSVINHFLDEITKAREEGSIGTDASVPLAESFYTSLRDKSPDGYANLRLMAARDLLGEMFQEASAKGDESLWLSAQHIARAIASVGKDVTDVAQIRAVAERMGIPFYAKAEMQGLSRGSNDPVNALRAENQRLRAQVEGRSVTNQAAQFDQWYNGTSQAVNKSVLDDAVKPALASVADAWKKFPDDYNRLVVDPLHREVAKTIRADQGFKARIDLLNVQARRATSAQKRDEIGQQIKQAFVNRAKLAAEAVKRPILDFAATRLKEQATQTHARREGAQNRSTPQGTAGTVQRSLVPKELPQMAGGVYDPKVAMRQMQALLS